MLEGLLYLVFLLLLLLLILFLILIFIFALSLSLPCEPPATPQSKIDRPIDQLGPSFQDRSACQLARCSPGYTGLSSGNCSVVLPSQQFS